MKRKLVYVGIPLLFGLLFASFSDISNDYIAAPCMIISALFLKYPAKMKNAEIFVCIASFSFGFFLYRADENLIYKKSLEYVGQTVSFSGKIQQVSDYTADMSSYILKGKINGVQNVKILYYGNSEECRYGDEIKLVCTLKEFENTYNFNTADYYKSSGIFMQTDNIVSVEIIKSDCFSLVNVIYDYRNYIYSRIMSYMPYTEGNLFCGMLFGSKIADIDDNTKTALYNLGIGHVFAVSGFHLMAMASFVNILSKKLRSGRIFSFVLVTVSTVVFVICSGFSISALRAGIMILISFSAGIFARKSDSLNSLSIAVILICFFNPFSVRNPSFLLSVSGFYGIGVFAPYMTENMKSDTKLQKIFKYFVSMICMSLIVIPISSLFFNETSAISAFANIVFMPFISAMLLMGMIIFITGGVPFIAYPLLKISSVLCRIIISASEFTASLKFKTIPLGYDFIKIIMFVSVVLIIVTYAVFRKRSYIALSVMMSLSVISGSIFIYQRISENILDITVFGKNSSDMLIIRHRNSADVIDISGKRKNARYVQTYIQRYGIENITSLSVFKNQYRSMAEYDKRLKWYNVESVYFPYGTYILENSCICGCEPLYSGSEGIKIQYPDFLIYADAEKSEIYIRYGEFFIVCGENIKVYKNQNEILQGEINNYISLKTDGISKTEFMG